MTRTPVVPRSRAELDVDEAVQFYLDEGALEAVLGLIDELERTFTQIARHPAAGSARYGCELGLPGLRSWPLRRFPDLVFSVEREESIDVWRILHGQRDIPASIVVNDAPG